MLDDQTFTGRQQAAQQPGTCLHCHASVYVPYRKLGGGDLVKGFEAMNRMPFAEARQLVSHPVSCIDCHAPDTMQLRVTRPGFMEGIRALAYYDREGFKDWTHRESGAPALKAQHPEFEMWSQGIHARSGVTCADCHMRTAAKVR